MPEASWCERNTATPTSPIHLHWLGPEGRKLGGGIRGVALCGNDSIANGWDLPSSVADTFESWSQVPQSQPGRVCLPCVAIYRHERAA